MKIRNYQFCFLLVKFLKIQAGEYRQNLTNSLLGNSNQKLLTLPVQYDNTSLLMTLGVLISQIVEIVSILSFDLKKYNKNLFILQNTE
jgi:hypothetical protein